MPTRAPSACDLPRVSNRLRVAIIAASEAILNSAPNICASDCSGLSNPDTPSALGAGPNRQYGIIYCVSPSPWANPLLSMKPVINDNNGAEKGAAEGRQPRYRALVADTFLSSARLQSVGAILPLPGTVRIDSPVHTQGILGGRLGGRLMLVVPPVRA